MRILPIVIGILLLSCAEPAPRLVTNAGNAQGSTYSVKYIMSDRQDYHDEIKQILQDIDLSMSTWVSSSLISQVNETGDWVTVDTLFINVLNRALEISEESDGNFDPTVGPLVKLWGFWFDETRKQVSEQEVKETLEMVGYDRVEIDGLNVRIPENSTMDFNAIAQGYTVDVISEFLESKGIKRYMVEVGGEVRARGVNIENKVWVIGVDKPQETIDPEDRFQFILKLEDASLATSGNYRKFWVDDETGLKYSHTIDPISGYPAKNNLLSATMITDNAMDADAYATLCMVIGLEPCKDFVENKVGLETYLVYADDNGEWQTFISEGFKESIIE